MISIIVAADKNYVIGNNGKMPWRFPADFAYFKDRTMGHPMITGRKNYQDMGSLPGRETIVVTRDKTYDVDKGYVAYSLDGAIALAETLDGSDEIFIVGGGQIYEAALADGLVDRIYLTHISRTEYPGDTYFPHTYLENFNEAGRTVRYSDDKNPERLEFIIHNKKEQN